MQQAMQDANFSRGGTEKIAGTDCTVWRYQGQGQNAEACITADGVMVEDLGSANGTFVANQRVQQSALLKPGEELRLDTVRFQLVAPGMDARQQSAAVRPEPAAATDTNSGTSAQRRTTLTSRTPSSDSTRSASCRWSTAVSSPRLTSRPS